MFKTAITVTLVVALALAIYTPANAAGLTGSERIGFVSSSIVACIKSGSKSAPSLNADQVTRYCTCASEMLADSITSEEVLQLSASTMSTAPQIAERARAAAKSCMERIKHS